MSVFIGSGDSPEVAKQASKLVVYTKVSPAFLISFNPFFNKLLTNQIKLQNRENNDTNDRLG